MDPILAIAREAGLIVIEDAAQAIGAEYKRPPRRARSATGLPQLLPVEEPRRLGDGGMVVTNDPDLADRIKLLRTHGYRPKYYNKVVGGNFRLDAIQAAVLRVKLRYLDGWTEARRRNAETYRRLLRRPAWCSTTGTAARWLDERLRPAPRRRIRPPHLQPVCHPRRTGAMS